MWYRSAQAGSVITRGRDGTVSELPGSETLPMMNTLPMMYTQSDQACFADHRTLQVLDP